MVKEMQWNPTALFTMPTNKHKNLGDVYIGLIFFTQFKNLKKSVIYTPSTDEK
jgi:hypothetical protein